jgi:hypothetical protein
MSQHEHHVIVKFVGWHSQARGLVNGDNYGCRISGRAIKDEKRKRPATRKLYDCGKLLAGL